MKKISTWVNQQRKSAALTRNQKLVDSMDLDRSKVVSMENVVLGRLIGQGGFAEVFHCTMGGSVAVAKMIKCEKLTDEMAYLMTNECKIWARVQHPNIVNFFGAALHGSSVCLLCEFMAGGSLFDVHVRLRRKGTQPDVTQLCDQFIQIARGMAYLHAMEPPVLHRDLKSANILLAEGAGGPRLAIADFGLARYQADDRRMTAETGSYRWMAPEVIRHEPYDEHCDVYSFAILAWEMLTYRIPFEDATPVEAALAVAREGSRPEIPQSTHPALIQLVETCWAQDARARPRMVEVVAKLDEAATAIAATEGERRPSSGAISIVRPSSWGAGLANLVK